MIRDVLGPDLVGAYLFGSAVLGGLKPHSDLDVMAVSRRRLTRDEKQRLVSALLEISLRPRPLEVTIVVESDIRPWRYPPRMDLQYGDWWRDEFERGNSEPWSSPNPDLASLIRMVLLADTTLEGISPAEVFDPVPRADYIAALVHGIDGWIADVQSDTVNVVLALARIWKGVVTNEVVPKDAAADWALGRLPTEHQGVLAHARAVYLGDETGRSERFAALAPSYAEHVAAQIRESLRVRP